MERPYALVRFKSGAEMLIPLPTHLGEVEDVAIGMFMKAEDLCDLAKIYEKINKLGISDEGAPNS